MQIIQGLVYMTNLLSMAVNKEMYFYEQVPIVLNK